MSQSLKRGRDEKADDGAPPQKALKRETIPLQESLGDILKPSNMLFNDLTIVREKSNKEFYKKFEKKEKLEGFKNVRLCRRLEDNIHFIVVSFRKDVDLSLHQAHARYKNKLPCEGIMFCDTKAYAWFNIHQSFFDALRRTTNEDALYSMIKNGVSSLFETFNDGMLSIINERTILMNNANDIIFFRYPFIQMDDSIMFKHTNSTRSNTEGEKKTQLSILANIAKVAQYRRTLFSEVNSTKLSYTVTALSNQSWSVNLARSIISHVDDNVKIMQLSNFAWEQRGHDGGRLQRLANRVTVKRGQIDTRILDHFHPENYGAEERNNVNLDTCHSLKDYFHHLFDYRTHRKVTEIMLMELSENEFAEMYLNTVPIYRYLIFEEYEDVLPNVIGV